MKNAGLSILLLSGVFYVPPCLYAEGAPVLATASVTASDPKEDDLEDIMSDFVSIRNPFLSQLPVAAQIIKTPVEPVVQKVNNGVSQKSVANVIKAAPVVAAQLTKTTGPEVHLQGIMWGIERPQAIVNDTVVGVGDMVQEMQITGITKDGVEVLVRGQKFHFKMEQ